MKMLNGLFQADGDDQAKNNGGDMDEELAPGTSGVVRRMYIEHGGWLLRKGGRVGSIGRQHSL
jgi:hypothetical protein